MKFSWRYYMALVPLTASATPIGSGNLAYVDAVKDKAFCKANVAVVDGLNKDPLGPAYCAGMLDVPMTTVTETAIVTASVVPHLSTIGPVVPTSVRISKISVPTVAATDAIPLKNTTIGLPTLTLPTPTVTLTKLKTVDVTVTDTVLETELATTTLISTETLSCLTSAISGAFPTEVLPGPSRRTVEAEGASSAPGRVRRGFSDLLKGIGIADVPTNPLLLHDEGKEIARPLCIPPTWDEKRITKACACLTLSTAACATTTVMRTTTVPAVPTLGVGVGGLIGRGEAYRVKSAITEVVAGTVTNTITATSVSTVTKVKTVQAQATSIAGNGLSYKRYTHAFSGYVRDNGFTASFFKRRTPEGVGALGSLSWSTQNWPASPPRPGLLALSSAPAVLNHTKAAAGASFDAEQAAVVAQGFFVARAGAGTYVFEVPAELADNWAYLWLGEDAYCDWTDRNAVLSASRVADTISADGRFALDLADGEAVPFTYIWANGGGAGRSALRVRLPNGGVGVGVIGEGGADIAPYFVQACDAEVFAAKTFT